MACTTRELRVSTVIAAETALAAGGVLWFPETEEPVGGIGRNGSAIAGCRCHGLPAWIVQRGAGFEDVTGQRSGPGQHEVVAALANTDQRRRGGLRHVYDHGYAAGRWAAQCSHFGLGESADANLDAVHPHDAALVLIAVAEQ